MLVVAHHAVEHGGGAVAGLLWVIFEGVIIFIQSFDFKKVGFGSWWMLMILGILVVVLGVLGLYNVEVTGNIVAILIGIGIIAMGVAYLLAYSGIHKFEKEVVNFNNAVKDAMQQPEQE